MLSGINFKKLKQIQTIICSVLLTIFMLFKATKMSSKAENIDEFGRDLTLKNKKAAQNFIKEFTRKFAGMSWAEITFAIEEEEEEEEKRKQKKDDEIRRQLYIKGDYELEEGEIFE